MSDLVALAAKLPPHPVIADLFGIHINTASRWSRYARRAWAATSTPRPHKGPKAKL